MAKLFYPIGLRDQLRESISISFCPYLFFDLICYFYQLVPPQCQ